MAVAALSFQRIPAAFSIDPKANLQRTARQKRFPSSLVQASRAKKDLRQGVLSRSSSKPPLLCQSLRHQAGFRTLATSCDSRQGAGDPDLYKVLELATDAELRELSDILYGSSPLSPLLKSITAGDGHQGKGSSGWGDGGGVHEGGAEGGPAAVEGGEREVILRRLEARFLFLAADAQATLSGRRPTYRAVLLHVRERLRVPCPSTLSTPDLEAEIFLHLVNDYTSRPAPEEELESASLAMERWQQRQRQRPSPGPRSRPINSMDGVRGGAWSGGILSAVRLGSQELMSMLVKGGSAVTVSALQRLALGQLASRLLFEKAKYKVAKEVLQKGGAAIATKLEAQFALLAARQGLAGAASRYAALRSMASVLGPFLWGLFMAEMVVRAVGTDYARIVRAIFAFAQIRLTRTYGWSQS